MQFFLSFHKCYTTTKAAPKKKIHIIKEEDAKIIIIIKQTTKPSRQIVKVTKFFLSFIFFPPVSFRFYFSVIPFFLCFNTREADDDEAEV